MDERKRFITYSLEGIMQKIGEFISDFLDRFHQIN